MSLGPTGKYRVPSEMHRRAYELWRDEVNLNGGPLGRPVDITIVDDHSDADRAAAIYKDLISGDMVDHVFGPYSSDIMTAVAPIVEAEGFPLLAAGAAGDSIWKNGYQNIFAILTPASRYTVGMLRIAQQAGLSTVALVSANDSFSTEIAAGTIKWASYLKLKLVLQLEFPNAATDLTGPMQQARDSKADLLIVAGHRDEAINARRALAELGWQPRAFYATIGPALPEWTTELGEFANGAFSTSVWETILPLAFPGANIFAEKFRKRYGVEPSYQAATAYAAGQILEAAAQMANSLDRDAIRDALYQLDTYSILGRFVVDHTGMQVKRLDMIIQWQQDEKAIVWPEEFQTASAIIAKMEP
ncbi:MAG: amino acid ABC transporter substrate-binding protein [Candidatus Binatota bacterium]|nr:amino acid ABC transporter substrate-binding protein [Candidatus Binatota bacterium]